MTRAVPAVLKPRLRLVRGGTILLGPGKADLLQAIAETESLTAAAARFGMSYKRGWTLVRELNAAFAGPLVATEKGGASAQALLDTSTVGPLGRAGC